MADKETELMIRVRSGDRTAFEALYRLYERPLGNYFYRLCWNRARTEDLLQETFLRLWKAAPRWKPTAKVSTFIFRVAHNLFINESSKRREQPLENRDGETHEDPSENLRRDETKAAVRRAVESLPEGERECLLLSEFNGMKYAEISEILSIPVGTVKSRMFSAVQRLKEGLKDLRPEA